MKTPLTLLALGGIVTAGGLAVAPSLDERTATAVVTLGPLEPPVLPPRVRVTNDRSDSVHVFYVVEATDQWRWLGSVASAATRTFRLPDDVGTIRFVLAPAGGEEPFVSGWIAVDVVTDVAVESVDDIDRSRVAVEAVLVSWEVPR